MAIDTDAVSRGAYGAHTCSADRADHPRAGARDAGRRAREPALGALG
jgi:hypothetical protein